MRAEKDQWDGVEKSNHGVARLEVRFELDRPQMTEAELDRVIEHMTAFPVPDLMRDRIWCSSYGTTSGPTGGHTLIMSLNHVDNIPDPFGKEDAEGPSFVLQEDEDEEN